jgi:Uma2 family endonuclease
MALTKPIKPAGTWTYEDLFDLPDDGKRYEIIEGELYEMPAPGSAHARAVIRLAYTLFPMLLQLGGELLTAPLDVFFPGANPVQPDIVGLLQMARHESCRVASRVLLISSSKCSALPTVTMTG